MTNEEIIKLLKIEKDCVYRADYCDRQCNKCDLAQDTNKLLEMYDEVINKLEMLNVFEEEFSTIVSEYNDLVEENMKLRKELKQRRKEKKKWKRAALNYKEAAENWEQTCHVYEAGLSNMRNRIKNFEREGNTQ